MGPVPPGRLKALLNVHSFFSFGAGASSPTTLARRAAELGYRSLALTDEHGVYGAAELARAARTCGLRALYGATVHLELRGEGYPLVLLAASREGYAGLNELLSLAHEGGKTVTLPVLLAHAEGLFLLTGPRRGFLSRFLAERKVRKAEELLLSLKGVFKDRLFVQLYHDLHPGDARRGRVLRALARDLSLPVVFAPEVRYAVPELYPLYDALVCARLGITVDTPHLLRPRNAAQSLVSPEEAAARLPFSEAIANAEAIASEAHFDLLPDRLTPPAARVPAGLSPEQYLEERCHEVLLERYGGVRFAEARARLEEELSTVRALGLAGFFLVAAEVSDYCRSRGILSAGRGSAAASVVCYLLGITKADPIAHNLLFERFLHTGKTALPDVDIDIGSARRDEVILWVEERFGSRGEAMTANRITYRLPLAVQDLGRALGLPPPLRDRLGKALGRDWRHLRPHHAREAEGAFTEVLSAAPVKEVLLTLLEKVEPGFVRHMAPHSGGVVLSQWPLTHYSPRERSSGGIRLLQFDKDDIESLGLIKLDLLGLRMLSALERAREEVYRTSGSWLELADLPDDPAVWRLIATGETMGLFQIESPGQTRLARQLKPKNLEELAHQVALFRPGPIHSGTVHPYLRRRQGRERVSYPHPALEPILARTQGVIFFQEQVLRIAVYVAGMSWAGADRFRKGVSEAEDAEELGPHRRRFVEGAARTVGASRDEAERVFDMIRAFQGYGFAESHAWAFALHAYASAWLRLHYPAEFLAAVLTEAPGMWPASTLRQEARTWGVAFLKLDVNLSGVHYRCELEDGEKAIRPPLTAVEGVSQNIAREICLDRLEHGPYASVDDLYGRVRLGRETFEALIRGGAFDRLHGRREALYRLGVLHHAHASGERPLFSAVPNLPPLERQEVNERFAWDYALKGFSEQPVHPLDLTRHRLLELGALNLAFATKTPGLILTAGLVVARQKPPTAKGFAFFVLEDGPLRVQLIIPPDVWARYTVVLRDTSVLLVEGEVQGRAGDRAIKAERVWGIAADVRAGGYRY